MKFARQTLTFSGVEISLAGFLSYTFPGLYWRPDDIKPLFFTVVKANVNSKLKVARLKRTFTAIYEADLRVFDGGGGRKRMQLNTLPDKSRKNWWDPAAINFA